MPGHSDKKAGPSMGAGGMDIPDISREEQVMRDLPKGNVPTDMEELKRLNPTMDFRTADEVQAQKTKTLQSDMMMLQNLFQNGDPMMGEQIKKLMDMVGAGFTLEEVLGLINSIDPRSVVRQDEMPMGVDNQADAMRNMQQGMMGALQGIGAVPTTRKMGDGT
tara:strand:+ start:231 stop:719 length:489 start_codon:yes stop_codon:yes gene_type:complete